MKALNDNEKLDPLREFDPLKNQVLADEDDPLKKKESEKLISYVEHFHNLLEFSQFEAAAVHAAASPMAILRTPQAMQKFKEAEHHTGSKSPLFLYCEALMSTTAITDSKTNFKLPANMSLECIACALNESGINLAAHWLCNPCIEGSLPLADLFVNWCKCVGNCVCQCQAIAEGIYFKLMAHENVASTLAKQGKYHAIIEYGKTYGDFKVSHYKALLASNLSLSCATILLQSNINSPKFSCGLSFCSIVNVLLANDEEVLSSFLQNIYLNGIRDSTNKWYSLHDLIFMEKYSDEMTNEKWRRVIEFSCFKNGSIIATEILSILLVREALSHASISCSMDYIS